MFTVSSVPSGVTNQTLTANFDIDYPAGNGLSFVSYNELRVYEARDNVNYSFAILTQMLMVSASTL